MKISVILPTYNEKENIVSLIRKLCQVLADGKHDYQVIVVDDNSPDGTSEVVRQTFSGKQRIQLVCRNGQRGLATAVRTGIEKSSGDVIVLMDVDFSHNPDDVPALISRLGDYDIVNGSRYLRPGGFRGNVRARFFSAAINCFLRHILGLNTTDNTNGFLVFKRSILQRWDLDRIFYGYGDFHFRLMHLASRNSLRIIEIPVIYRPRQKGKAKTRFLQDGWGYVISALKIRLGSRRL